MISNNNAGYDAYVVIGNGFDIECGLPTGYTDFLNFLEVVKRLLEKEDIKDVSKLVDYTIIENLGKDNALNEWEPILHSFWYNHFISEAKGLQKRWLDFENEIDHVIYKIECSMTLENIIFLRRDDALTILEYSDLGKILFPIVKDIPRKETFYLGRDYTEFEITYQNLALRMQEDLDVFICAFEKYLRDYVSMVQPRITSSIESLLQKVSAGKNKRIITFNYTDTLEKLLRNRNIIAEYCYIHGKVDPTKHNRVVLGTDDHMQGENYIPFAPFCKHNQRIFKETDSNYMDWIEAFLNYAMPPSHLFVFGHSCGLSDQDILRGLITAPGMNTSIFAHSDSTKIKLVGNLTEILGKDEMIRRNAGSDRTMEFLEQI